MGHVRCARVADYAAALSRGNTYEVLDGNERNLKIRTEEGRVRWFPRTWLCPWTLHCGIWWIFESGPMWTPSLVQKPK